MSEQLQNLRKICVIIGCDISGEGSYKNCALGNYYLRQILQMLGG